ncbi:MAG: class D beta-lactamase [Blastocatellia bacterium]
MRNKRLLRLWAMLSLIRVSAEVEAQDLSKYFQNTGGAFVLYDLKNDRYLRYNERRCRERFSPFSTFKIPNSLIGLETGVVKDAEFVITWDSKKYPAQDNFLPEWNRDHALRSAIKYSVVWYYSELAKSVGETRMKEWVTKLGYGNQDISGGIDRFWLRSSLRISADEQIEFLKKLYREQLPVSKRSIEIVKDILTLEKTAEYKLSGKTGGGPLDEGKDIGWFVGYLESKGNVYFFALNLEGDSFTAIRDRRINLTKQILTGLGYLPRQ